MASHVQVQFSSLWFLSGMQWILLFLILKSLYNWEKFHFTWHMSLIIASSPVVLVFYSWTPKVIGFHLHSLPYRDSISFIIFIFLSFCVNFVEFWSLFNTALIWFYIVPNLFFTAIQFYPAMPFFDVLNVLSSLRNLSSHLIQCLSLWFSVTISEGWDVLHSTTYDPVF